MKRFRFQRSSKILLRCGILIILVSPLRLTASAEIPRFRILAPEFICPKDEDTPVEKPDNTVITLQTTADAAFDVVFAVRWQPLVPPPSQRLTLLLWRTVRALEKRLNAPQAEPYVYVIPNDELLHGVSYEFQVSAIESGEVSPPKSFRIDNTQGESKLDMVEGRGDLIYVVLLTAQVVYSDAEHVVNAQVTSCFPTQDYYFVWTVRVHSSQSEDSIDVSATRGSRLVIPPYSLKPGVEYDAKCQVIKRSTGLMITQTGLPFQVLKRTLKVYLSADYLVLPVNYPFVIDTQLLHNDAPVKFEWECTLSGTPCDNFESSEFNDTLFFPMGLSGLGEHEIRLTVNTLDETAEASAVIKTVEHSLPVIQIAPVPRILNEHSTITLIANASNVAPTCTLTWYFADEEFFASAVEVNDTCDGCEHGTPLSDTLTIFSLEENFLNELTDYSNETEWRQVTGEMAANAGRARFVVTCGCSITFECTTMGTVYADLHFEINKSPKPVFTKIVPSSGAALETTFRVSTRASLDADTPLRYYFYCRIGDNETMLLGSFVQYLAVETFLPYVEGGTDVWVEICDSLGACSAGSPTSVPLSPGDGATAHLITEEVKGHITRCEVDELHKVTAAAIVTYTNAEQTNLLSKFTSELLAALPPDPTCIRDPEKYTTFLNWLSTHGIDTSGLD